MSFEAFQHPAPTSWEVFEDLSCALFAEVWGDPTARKNGRRGDEQHGVDVCGRLPNGDWVAVQCKGKDNYAEKEVMPAELRKEVAKALTFRPQLTQWILITSGPKRPDVEALAREITDEHRAQGLFEVQARGWDDLCHLIGRHETVIERYFPEVAPKMRRVAQQVEEMHGILADLRGGAATITPRDLVGGVPTPLAAPTAFDSEDAGRVRRILGAQSATLLAWPTTTAVNGSIGLN